MVSNCGAGEDSWESLGLQGDQTSQSSRKSIQNIHWKDWCWSWSSNILATWCKELTHWKRLWCWERLKAGEEGDNRGWDGWMASPTRWTWVWVNSGSWWWTGRPGVLQSLGSQRVRHDWATKNKILHCGTILTPIAPPLHILHSRYMVSLSVQLHRVLPTLFPYLKPSNASFPGISQSLHTGLTNTRCRFKGEFQRNCE